MEPWRILVCSLLLATVAVTEHVAEGDTKELGDRLLAELAVIQQQNLAGSELSQKRALVCKSEGGLGNRIQGAITCLAMGMAMRRAVVFDWVKISEDEDPNGMMPCTMDDLFLLPPGSGSWGYDELIKDVPMGEVTAGTVEVYKSVLMMQSGVKADWRDLLLCNHFAYLVKNVPLVAMRASRYVPVTYQNEHYAPIFEKFFSKDSLGNIPLFETLAPAFFRPVPLVAEAMTELADYLGNVTRIGLQIRGGLVTDDVTNMVHFFSPLMMADKGQGLIAKWAQCAYANMTPKMRSEAHVWVLAADSQSVKIQVLHQIAKEEGPVSAELNAAALLHGTGVEVPPGIEAISPPKNRLLHVMKLVVVRFQSGSKLVMWGAEATRRTCPDVQAALVEMLALSSSSFLVSSHLSTFAALPSATVSKDHHFVITRDGDCLPSPGSEPLSDASDLFEGAQCYRASVHHRNSWSRPRIPMTRAPRTQK